MEYSLDNIHNFTIFAKTSPDSGSTLGYGFVHEVPNRAIFSYPDSDFYLPIFLTRTGNLLDYVDITHDQTIFTIERQEINPWFIEFGFFDTIKRNKVNQGSDLTLIMLNYIRTVRPDIASLNDTDLKTWFDITGRYQLPWNQGTPTETDLDVLEKISLLNQDIISKAYFFNIDINS